MLGKTAKRLVQPYLGCSQNPRLCYDRMRHSWLLPLYLLPVLGQAICSMTARNKRTCNRVEPCKVWLEHEMAASLRKDKSHCTRTDCREADQDSPGVNLTPLVPSKGSIWLLQASHICTGRSALSLQSD